MNNVYLLNVKKPTHIINTFNIMIIKILKTVKTI